MPVWINGENKLQLLVAGWQTCNKLLYEVGIVCVMYNKFQSMHFTLFIFSSNKNISNKTVLLSH